MKIGVVSDTHNNLRNVGRIVELFNDYGVERVIHTGDINGQRFRCGIKIDTSIGRSTIILNLEGETVIPEAISISLRYKDQIRNSRERYIITRCHSRTIQLQSA